MEGADPPVGRLMRGELPCQHSHQGYGREVCGGTPLPTLSLGLWQGRREVEAKKRKAEMEVLEKPRSEWKTEKELNFHKTRNIFWNLTTSENTGPRTNGQHN